MLQKHSIKRTISPQKILMFGWGGFAVLGLGIAGFSSVLPSDTNAATQINATIDKTGYYLNMTASPGDIEMNVSPSATGDTMDSATDSLNVKTNIPTGYELYISATSTGETQNSLYNTYTPPEHTTDSISAVSTTPASAAPLNSNTWGYGVPSGTEGLVSNQFDTDYSNPTITGSHWAGVPATAASDVVTYAQLIQTIGHANDALGGTNINFHYAVSANANKSSGTYTGTVIYTVIADVPEPVDLTFDEAYAAFGKTKDVASGLYKMQDMSTEICDAVKIPTSTAEADTQTSTLVDTRTGNKTYKVAKLLDGKCWMTQNLDFDITGEKLTSADTNLVDTTEWTPDHTTIPKDQLSTWDDTSTSPRSYDPGEEYIFTSNTTSDDTIYTSLTACTEAGHTASECMHYSSGNLYNWTAAKATNNSTSQTAYASSSNDSICPKGWTLPSANSAAPSDFGTMLYAQGIISGTTATSYASDGFNKVRTAPLYWVRAGYVYGGSRGLAGVDGYYWSSTAYNSNYAYNAGFNSSYIGPRSSYGRYGGRSVRCIAI